MDDDSVKTDPLGPFKDIIMLPEEESVAEGGTTAPAFNGVAQYDSENILFRARKLYKRRDLDPAAKSKEILTLLDAAGLEAQILNREYPTHQIAFCLFKGFALYHQENPDYDKALVYLNYLVKAATQNLAKGGKVIDKMRDELKKGILQSALFAAEIYHKKGKNLEAKNCIKGVIARGENHPELVNAARILRAEIYVSEMDAAETAEDEDLATDRRAKAEAALEGCTGARAAELRQGLGIFEIDFGEEDRPSQGDSSDLPLGGFDDLEDGITLE